MSIRILGKLYSESATCGQYRLHRRGGACHPSVAYYNYVFSMSVSALLDARRVAI